MEDPVIKTEVLGYANALFFHKSGRVRHFYAADINFEDLRDNTEEVLNRPLSVEVKNLLLFRKINQS